jgi:hypothetical protein
MKLKTMADKNAITLLRSNYFTINELFRCGQKAQNNHFSDGAIFFFKTLLTLFLKLDYLRRV